MASSASETTPLIPTQSPASPDTQRKVPRNVTFNPNPAIISIDSNSSISSAQQPSPTAQTGHANAASSPQPMLAGLKSQLRRRHSHGAPISPVSVPAQKLGPLRTTKNSMKLKLLPNPDFGDDGPDEESGRDVYSQYTRIKDPTARRDAARLGKADRERLPRVTAYCTAGNYQLASLMKYLEGGRAKSRGAKPKMFDDECIYTPFDFHPHRERKKSLDVHSRPTVREGRRHSDSALEVDDNPPRAEDLIDLSTEVAGDLSLSNGEDMQVNRMHTSNVEQHVQHQQHEGNNPDFDINVHIPEVFLFEYGVVVIWGMSEKDEGRFLKDIAKFEVEKVANPETENFNFYYTREYQARIYNDFITLREKGNYMTKLAISHALAQSAKTSLFEAAVEETIEKCKDIPSEIAETGKISLSRTEINQQIGNLFILRINIHLNGSVLDTPEFFWDRPQLSPVYDAVRSYLEMDQRVNLLTDRLGVIADLLAVLKEQLSYGHGEKLEWVVIVLIAIEIAVAAVNIFVDLYADQN